jgi:hypothetical protein
MNLMTILIFKHAERAQSIYSYYADVVLKEGYEGEGVIESIINPGQPCSLSNGLDFLTNRWVDPLQAAGTSCSQKDKKHFANQSKSDDVVVTRMAQ